MNKTRKVKVPNVVRGGAAIPIGSNLFYMKGKKHEQGGIDIGNTKDGLEVEDGEVMQVNKNNVKVFSSLPFLYGESPAELVMSGIDPKNVFDAQEEFKDRNNLNDDGTMKQYKNGGLSRSKDYGSKDKPYPKVNSNQFAGKNRTYPIPTKDDAIDALRLAGLHGRSNVKAKVYRKYPELKKKALLGIEDDSNTEEYILKKTGTDIEDIRKKGLAEVKNKNNNVPVGYYDRFKTSTKSNNNETDFTNLILDGISGGLNVIGNIASGAINNKMLNDLEYTSAPTPTPKLKLKTRININPQIQRLYNDLRNNEELVNNNTASSRTALARNQRLRNLTTQQINDIIANKENIETQLINQDRQQQQRTALIDSKNYNKWKEGLADFNNKVRELKSENSVAVTQGIIDSINSAINSLGYRNLEARNLAYLQQSNPYAIEALSNENMKDLLRNNGYIRIGRDGGKFKLKFKK